MPFTFSELLFMFFVYAFVGWCCEVVYAAVKSGKFVNRGFLNGPVCPVYGFGFVGVIVALTPLEDNLILLFIGSFFLTSLIEFLTGFALETIFHTKWWDYSDNHFNIKGYVCLEFSLIWGLAATAVLKLVHPLIYKGITLLPDVVFVILLCVFTAVIIIDFAATLVNISHFRKKLRALTAMANEIHDISDKLGDKISEGVLNIRQKTDENREFYAGYREMCNAHRAEEKEMLDRHNKEEQKLLCELKISGTHERGLKLEVERAEFNRKLGELRLRLREANSSSRRLLNAFPNLRASTSKLNQLTDDTAPDNKANQDNNRNNKTE